MNTMEINEKYGVVADQATIEKTVAALEKNGIHALTVETGAEAKEKVFELLPKEAEVMNMTSMTLDSIGVSEEIMESGNYNAIRKEIESLDRKTQGLEMQKLGAAPEWVVGSVHAVTEDGKVLIASASGSQLPAYAGGSSHVIWVVGAQKIVKDFDEGIKRLYEYSLPLEDERARKVYGMGSGVNKILVVNKEFVQGRITMIIIKEKLGF